MESDDYTVRMTNLNVAHVKIRANCTKPLLAMVELIRENGVILPISVEYPWVPPTCPCFKQLGHLQTRCPNAQWQPKKLPTENSTEGNSPETTNTPHGDLDAVSPNLPTEAPAANAEHSQPQLLHQHLTPQITSYLPSSLHFQQNMFQTWSFISQDQVLWTQMKR